MPLYAFYPNCVTLYEVNSESLFGIAGDLHEDVEHYILTNKELKHVVHLHKTNRREGLIRARIFGANLATGEVT